MSEILAAPTDTPAADVVLCDVDGDGVATVTLNRPARMNAWNDAMEVRYFDVLDAADADPAVRVIVLTGAGRGFCPGKDMADLEVASRGPGQDHGWRTRPMTHGLTIRKPMIAAINGGCAGIGLVQALVCDIRFAASGAKLATSFARRGLPAEFASSWLLTRLIGTGRAMDLLLSARTVSAQEASDLGLVNWVCAPDELLPAATAYARDLALNCSPSSMAAVKAQVAADWHRTYEESLIDAVARVADPAGRPDFQEGVASFVERRPPRFRPLPPRTG